MIARVVAALVAACLLLAAPTTARATGEPTPPPPQASYSALDAAQDQIAGLVWRLAHGKIRRVEILTNGDVLAEPYPPQGLEGNFAYKLSIVDINRAPYRDGLLAALQTVSVMPSTRESAAKWAAIFYDHKDERVASLYLDGATQVGAVDGTPVTFRGQLAEWLEANVPLLARQDDATGSKEPQSGGGTGWELYDAMIAAMTGPQAKWLEICVFADGGGYAYKLRIETRFYGTFVLEELARVSKATMVTPTIGQERRWTLIALDEKEGMIGVLVVDAAKTAARMGEAPVTLNDGLGGWLNARFGAYFR